MFLRIGAGHAHTIRRLGPDSGGNCYLRPAVSGSTQSFR